MDEQSICSRIKLNLISREKSDELMKSLKNSHETCLKILIKTSRQLKKESKRDMNDMNEINTLLIIQTLKSDSSDHGETSNSHKAKMCR